MAKTFSELHGMDDLKTALAELPKATANNVLLRVLTKAGQPIADAGEQNAPRGATGKLAESYVVSRKLSKNQKSKNRKESKVEVYVGPTPHPKSVQTEFGNSHMPAQPHLRPAWDSNKDKALVIVTSELGGEIEKARKRLARKAEREAAKMRQS